MPPQGKKKSRKKKTPPAPVVPHTNEEEKIDLEVESQEEFDRLWLTRAMTLVYGERQQTYGHPYDVYLRAKSMWGVVLGVNVSFTQFCYCLMLLKMCRELVGGGHPDEDNNVDIAGYVGVLNEIKDYIAKLEVPKENPNDQSAAS